MEEPSFFLSFFYLSGRDEYSCADSGIPSSTFRQDKTTREKEGGEKEGGEENGTRVEVSREIRW